MTNHHESNRKNDGLVVAYTADSTSEALVIRGLLESNGIKSPDPTTSDPFPLNEPPEGTHGPEIYTLESQAAEARRIIGSYRKKGTSAAASE
jgi:hypothetical protein